MTKIQESLLLFGCLALLTFLAPFCINGGGGYDIRCYRSIGGRKAALLAVPEAVGSSFDSTMEDVLPTMCRYEWLGSRLESGFLDKTYNMI